MPYDDDFHLLMFYRYDMITDLWIGRGFEFFCFETLNMFASAQKIQSFRRFHDRSLCTIPIISHTSSKVIRFKNGTETAARYLFVWRLDIAGRATGRVFASLARRWADSPQWNRSAPLQIVPRALYRGLVAVVESLLEPRKCRIYQTFDSSQ